MDWLVGQSGPLIAEQNQSTWLALNFTVGYQKDILQQPEFSCLTSYIKTSLFSPTSQHVILLTFKVKHTHTHTQITSTTTKTLFLIDRNSIKFILNTAVVGVQVYVIDEVLHRFDCCCCCRWFCCFPNIKPQNITRSQLVSMLALRFTTDFEASALVRSGDRMSFKVLLLRKQHSIALMTS